MISRGLFSIHPNKITCNKCSVNIIKFMTTTNIKWADAIQKFMEDHKETCWTEAPDAE